MTTNTPPTPAITIPRVVNLPEARNLSQEYPAIITSGPSAGEVNWGHPNHHVESFSDTTWGAGKPSIQAVERMLEFAAKQPHEILIHCHAGMSRSTATAWGVLMGRGVSDTVAFDVLHQSHPMEGRQHRLRRAFIPNLLIVQHLEDIFGIDGLVEYARNHSSDEWII